MVPTVVRECVRCFQQWILSAVIVICIVGCGGGGGGGEGSERGVRLIHGGLSLPPVSFALGEPGSARLAPAVPFAERSVGLAVGSGAQRIQVFTNGGTRVLFDAPTVLDAPDGTVVLVFEDGDLARTAVFPPGPKPAGNGNSGIRLINAVSGAPNLSMQVGDSKVTASLGSASPYIEVPSGVSPVTVLGQGVRVTLSVNAAAGTRQTVLLAGEIDYFVHSKVFEDR